MESKTYTIDWSSFSHFLSEITDKNVQHKIKTQLEETNQNKEQNKKQNKKVCENENNICPISHEIMLNPVLTSCEHKFDKNHGK